MIVYIKENMDQITALFRKYKMRKVWLFGSALDENHFGLDSDIDFLYEPNKEEMTIREFLDNPLLLNQELEALLSRKIDLIRNLPFRNPYFKEELERTKILIFDHAERSEKISL